MSNSAWMRSLLALFAAAMICRTARAQEGIESPKATNPESPQQLDEVKVIARRPWQIRQEIEEVEARFFALFNSINSRDMFDIHCAMQPGFNSKLKRRSCLPRFYLDVKADRSSDFLDGMMMNGRITAGVPERSAASAREREFNATARAVIAASPELQRLSRQWQDLKREHALHSKDPSAESSRESEQERSFP